MRVSCHDDLAGLFLGRTSIAVYMEEVCLLLLVALITSPALHVCVSPKLVRISSQLASHYRAVYIACAAFLAFGLLPCSLNIFKTRWKPRQASYDSAVLCPRLHHVLESCCSCSILLHYRQCGLFCLQLLRVAQSDLVWKGKRGPLLKLLLRLGRISRQVGLLSVMTLRFQLGLLRFLLA